MTGPLTWNCPRRRAVRSGSWPPTPARSPRTTPTRPARSRAWNTPIATPWRGTPPWCCSAEPRQPQGVEATMPFASALTVSDDTAVIKLAGELDARTAPDFHESIERAAKLAVRKLVIAMHELQYISTAGLPC